MAGNSTGFQLFSSSSGLFEDLLPPPPPPPPPVEVHSSQVSSPLETLVEPLDLDGLTFLKGRVSTKEVFGLPNSDLVPGVYEGGLKLWEGSLDLIKALLSEVQNGNLSFTGKRALELGCGHGLPGIFACLQGAAVVHFQDFNAEVLRSLTIPNVNINLSKSASNDTNCGREVDMRFFAGDWSQVHECLPYIQRNEKEKFSSMQSPESGYDIILMAETIYSISAQQSLYGLIKKCLHRAHGVVYMAAKKHYFGVGGGTRQFLSMLEKDGVMDASLVAEVADGSSNVREPKTVDLIVEDDKNSLTIRIDSFAEVGEKSGLSNKLSMNLLSPNSVFQSTSITKIRMLANRSSLNI